MTEPAASPRRRSTAEALVDGLLAHGVDTVFGLPGVQTYPLFEAVAAAGDRLTLYGARHEQTCAYMAFGYAQATGKVGVCSVVPGPGVLNASAALLTAYGASTPVLCLTGEIPTKFLGRGLGHLHEMPDQLATVRSFTKWAANVLSPADAPGLLDEAMHQALAGRPGPTVLAAPWDVLPQTAEVDPPRPRPVETPPIDHDEFDRAAALLAGAKRPMIMVGGGARHAAAEVRALAARLGAPAVSFRSGRGIVSNDDDLGLTCAEGFEAWPDTDVLLAIGSRQELAWFRWPDRPTDLTVVNLDIDPMQHIRLQPTVALTADAAEGTAHLLSLLAEQAPGDDRLERVRAARAGAREHVVGISPHVEYLAAIRDVMGDDGYLVEEICQVGFASYFGFPVRDPRHFITAGSQGTLGFGLPTALGVQAAHPGAPVVALSGDGGLMFGVQELATAVQHELGVVVVLFDNGSYGNVKADQQRIYGRPVGSDLTNPDFVALARSFGADAHSVADPAGLRPVLDAALAKRHPALIHIPMPLDPSVSPWRLLMPASRR
jgi:acetolactate synthase-1/2/3 large subunit